MSALFKNSDVVTVEELSYSREFYVNCSAIISSLNKIKNHIFDKNANSIEKMIILIICIIGILVLMVYTLCDYSFDLIFSPVSFVLLFPIIGVLVVSSVVKLESASVPSYSNGGISRSSGRSGSSGGGFSGGGGGGGGGGSW